LSAKFTHKGKIDSEALKRAIKVWLPTAGAAVAGQAVELAPIDTGNLKASIHYTVKGDTAIVGANTDYAEYVEYGTKFSQKQPFMRPAIDVMKDKLVRALQRLYDGEVRKDGKS
jgi:HK97 gp10 family phage protein